MYETQELVLYITNIPERPDKIRYKLRKKWKSRKFKKYIQRPRWRLKLRLR